MLSRSNKKLKKHRNDSRKVNPRPWTSVSNYPESDVYLQDFGLRSPTNSFHKKKNDLLRRYSETKHRKQSANACLLSQQASEIADELKRLKPLGSKAKRFTTFDESLDSNPSQLTIELEHAQNQLFRRNIRIKELEKENEKLKNNFNTVCEYIEEFSESRDHQPRFGFLNMSKKEASIRFEKAFTVMQFSIFKERYEDWSKITYEENFKSDIISCMETVLSELKLENCCLKTDLINTEHNFECIQEEINEKIEAIENIENKFQNYFDAVNKRLERAFEKLYCVCKKKKFKIK